ncbi:glycosyltransferase [Desulfovibrio sp. OttesenSCG-928-F20]|nr:glycosyltransferase [Desulfovibrio sp. OttesenSCG-928-M16]MDL2290895.1 glycosyltransferase [Desulfovibrio sp. OttesenSCG-928-F20]
MQLSQRKGFFAKPPNGRQLHEQRYKRECYAHIVSSQFFSRKGAAFVKLAFCNATHRWGGVKTWTVEVASALSRLGHETVVYGRDPAFIERALGMGLEAIKLDFGCDFNPATIAFFLREFRARGIDIVLVNLGKDLRTAGVAARLLGIALVQRVGLPKDRRNCLQVRLDNALLKPHYLCPCHFIRDGMLHELPFVKADRVSVVYTGKKPLVGTPAYPGQPLRLVSSSQVSVSKGHAELAHTLARLSNEGFDFFWEVVGTGNALEALRSLCAELGLADRTRFHGFVQDVPTLLRTCDVFVLPSYTEGLPNTLLEAMACGLVPVARDVGGVRECLPPEPAAFLAPFGPGINYAGWELLDSEKMPLYAPLKLILSATQEQVNSWKNLALVHCRTNFSLDVQSRKLALFFAERLAAANII